MFDFSKILSVKVAFTEEECYCGITEFYKIIAEKLGYDTEKVQYDCTKICVSVPIQNDIFKFYTAETEMSEEGISVAWVLYGPKANLSEDTYVAEVQKGFIIEV